MFSRKTDTGSICKNCPNCCCTSCGFWVTSEELARLPKLASLKVKPNDGLLWVTTEGKSNCPYLKPDQTCETYETRPFDCQLYPFVIDRVSKSGNALTVECRFHEECPKLAVFQRAWKQADEEAVKDWLGKLYGASQVNLNFRNSSKLGQRLRRVFRKPAE